MGEPQGNKQLAEGCKRSILAHIGCLLLSRKHAETTYSLQGSSSAAARGAEVSPASLAGSCREQRHGAVKSTPVARSTGHCPGWRMLHPPGAHSQESGSLATAIRVIQHRQSALAPDSASTKPSSSAASPAVSCAGRPGAGSSGDTASTSALPAECSCAASCLSSSRAAPRAWACWVTPIAAHPDQASTTCARGAGGCAGNGVAGGRRPQAPGGTEQAWHTGGQQAYCRRVAGSAQQLQLLPPLSSWRRDEGRSRVPARLPVRSSTYPLAPTQPSKPCSCATSASKEATSRGRARIAPRSGPPISNMTRGSTLEASPCAAERGAGIGAVVSPWG